MKGINKFYNDYINPSYSKYSDFDFAKLIKDYKVIELEIANDIKDIITYYFGFKNISNNGQRFFSRTHSFIFIPQFIESERLLHLIFRDENIKHPSAFEIKVEHFGAIRNIVLEYPDYLTEFIAEVSSIVQQYIFAAYTSLENAFKSKCEHMADKICKKINLILVNHLTAIGKKHLIDSTRFFVFQKEAGFFYFERESYSKTIDHFKLHQSNQYSAYELLVWLLTNPLPFAKSLSAKSFLKDGKLVWQEWDKAVFRDEKKFFEAARKLYDCEPYAVLAFYKSKNRQFSLSIAFKKNHKEEIVPELKKIRASIKCEFEEETMRYSSFIKKINLFKLEQSIVDNPNIYGEFIGHALAAFFKGMNHLH